VRQDTGWGRAKAETLVPLGKKKLPSLELAKIYSMEEDWACRKHSNVIKDKECHQSRSDYPDREGRDLESIRIFIPNLNNLMVGETKQGVLFTGLCQMCYLRKNTLPATLRSGKNLQ